MLVIKPTGSVPFFRGIKWVKFYYDIIACFYDIIFMTVYESLQLFKTKMQLTCTT